MLDTGEHVSLVRKASPGWSYTYIASSVTVQTMPSPGVVQASALLILLGTLWILALSEVEVMVDTRSTPEGWNMASWGYVRQKCTLSNCYRTLGNPVVGGGATCMLAQLMNLTSGEITIHKGTRVARVERIEEEAVATTSQNSVKIPPPREPWSYRHDWHICVQWKESRCCGA